MTDSDSKADASSPPFMDHTFKCPFSWADNLSGFVKVYADAKDEEKAIYDLLSDQAELRKAITHIQQQGTIPPQALSSSNDPNNQCFPPTNKQKIVQEYFSISMHTLKEWDLINSEVEEWVKRGWARPQSIVTWVKKQDAVELASQITDLIGDLVGSFTPSTLLLSLKALLQGITTVFGMKKEFSTLQYVETSFFVHAADKMVVVHAIFKVDSSDKGLNVLGNKGEKRHIELHMQCIKLEINDLHEAKLIQEYTPPGHEERKKPIEFKRYTPID